MRYDSIPSSLFSDRRKSFAKKMSRGSVAVFCSNDPMPRNGDQFYPFRQDTALFALSGLDQPGTIVVIFPDAEKKSHREMAFILPEDPEHAIWHGERYSTREARNISGISTIYPLAQWDRIMPVLIKSAKAVYIPPRYEGEPANEVLSPGTRFLEKLKQEYPQKIFLLSEPLLKQLLMIKHPLEIEIMKKAVDVTGQAFKSVLRTIRPGLKEYEVEAELTYALAKKGCYHAFEPIVASGKSACTLHYVRNNRLIGKDELVLIDFGAEYANMAADMSRTIPASGVFTKRQKAIYNSVLAILEEITQIMRPGITLKELNMEAGKRVERELIKLKICTKRDIRRQDPASPLHRKYFMHGISHHLGYDVHDLSDRNAALKPGMVLTCEPGLYIREEGIGIRLENDILITRGKPKNLMADIPVDPDDIEEIMHALKK